MALKADLKIYREMLATVRHRIALAVKAGKSLQEVQADKPTAEWDAKWGNGFIKSDKFVEIVYQDMRK